MSADVATKVAGLVECGALPPELGDVLVAAITAHDGVSPLRAALLSAAKGLHTLTGPGPTAVLAEGIVAWAVNALFDELEDDDPAVVLADTVVFTGFEKG